MCVRVRVESSCLAEVRPPSLTYYPLPRRRRGEYAAWLPTPAEQTHLVCFRSGAERDALQDSQLAAESEEAQERLARHWDEWFAPHAPLGELCCTHAAVQWAMAAVRTRAFSLDLDDATCALYPPREEPAACERVPGGEQAEGAQREAAGANTAGSRSGGAPEANTTEGKRAERVKGKAPAISAIAPFADMLNHSTDASTSYGVRAGEFRVALCASRNAGAEALLCYQATADNRQLMRTFGFTVPGNPHDRLPPPSSATARALYDDAAATGLNRVSEWSESEQGRTEESWRLFVCLEPTHMMRPELNTAGGVCECIERAAGRAPAAGAAALRAF